MDRQDTLRNLLLSLAVFFAVLWFWPRLMSTPPPRPPDAAPSADGTTDTGGQTASTHSATAQPPTTPAGAAEQPEGGESPGGLVAIEAETVQTVSIGSAAPGPAGIGLPPSPYRMRLELSNVGAAVESATITDHAEEAGGAASYKLLSPVEGEDGTRYSSLAVEQINIDGADLALDDKKWHVGPVTPYRMDMEEGEAVEFWIEVHGAAGPILKLTRSYKLPRQTRESGRRDLLSDITVQNLSNQPHSVVVTYRGGVGIRQAYTRGDDRYLDCGTSDGTRVLGTRKQQGEAAKNPGQPVPLYRLSAAAPGARLSWAAAANTYFTCTVAPLDRDGTDNARYISTVSGVDLDGSGVTDSDVAPRFATGPETVAAGEALSYPADIYLGEKNGETFREVDKYRARNYYYQVSQGYGFCTFTWLVELMMWLLNGLFWVVRDYGVAIIVLVLIVRALLHPVTKKGQVNMVRMQQRMGEFTPKIEELKKKYSNDKARLQQETMKLYREHGISPASQFLNCLPQFIQIPIWVALWISLSNNISMRHQPFHFTWVEDLTAPDALYTFAAPVAIPFFGWQLPAFNLLPILLSISMYVQMKLQPKPKPNPNMSTQQRQQQEMMQKMGPMMSIMMLLIFYKAPSGLNVYIMFSSLFGAVEQWRIRKHIKVREEAGTLHKAAPKQDAQSGRHRKPGKFSFIARLQQMAEDAQKAQAQRHPKGKPRR